MLPVIDCLYGCFIQQRQTESVTCYLIIAGQLKEVAMDPCFRTDYFFSNPFPLFKCGWWQLASRVSFHCARPNMWQETVLMVKHGRARLSFYMCSCLDESKGTHEVPGDIGII